MTTETIEEPEVLIPEIIPTAELERINATDAGFLTLSTEIETYIASGNQDKTANELTQICVKIRTESDKIARRLAKPYGDKYDEIIAFGKLIGARAKLLEDKVRPIKDAYESEQERIKKEKQEAEAKKVADRIDSLYKLKASFDGMTYMVNGIAIDAIEVKALPDDEWEHLYASAKLAYDNDQARLAEEQRIKDVEAKRIADEQEAERKRQAQVKAEQEAKEAQLRKEQEEFNRQRQELADKQVAFEKQQYEAEQKRIQAERDAAWAEQLRLDAIEEEKKQKQAAARKELLTARTNRLLEVGFVSDIDDMLTSSLGGWTPNMIADMFNEEFEQLIIESIAANKRREEEAVEAAKAQKAADQAKNKADKERSKRLTPDKHALDAYLSSLLTVWQYELTQPETKELSSRIEGKLALLVDELKQEVKAL